jgi:hypothetical protein
MTNRSRARTPRVAASIALAMLLAACSVAPGGTSGQTTTSPTGSYVSNGIVYDKDCRQDRFARACTTLEYAYHFYDGPGMITTKQPKITRTEDGRFRLTAASKEDRVAFHDVLRDFATDYERGPGWRIVQRDQFSRDATVYHLVAAFDRPLETPLTVRIELRPVPGEHATVVEFVAETEPNPVGDGS